MKLLKITELSILIVLFLSFDLCYAQTAEELNKKGVEYGSLGQFSEAKEAFEKALGGDPFYRGLENYLPWSVLSSGGPERCLKIIEDVDQQKIDADTAIYFFKGVEYFIKDQYDQVIDESNKALKINPDFFDAYIIRGLAYYRKGKKDKALSDYNKAIELNPDEPSAYEARTIFYQMNNQNDKAISDLNKAIELNPNNHFAYLIRANLYQVNNQYNKAISDYNKAIELIPDFALAYKDRGIAYGDIGNMKKACSDWKKACELGICYKYNIAKEKGICE